MHFQKDSSNNLDIKPSLKFLQRKQKRPYKLKMNRELKNLEDWWETSTLKKKENIIKKRGRKPKIALRTNTSNNFTYFKSPHPVDRKDRLSPLKKQNKNIVCLKRYMLDDAIYFKFLELLDFLKTYFQIDYENFILKDEQKQEFKVKINDFFKDYIRIYNKTQLFILDEFSCVFFQIISTFASVDYKELIDKFKEVSQRTTIENLRVQEEYIAPSVFASDSLIRSDDSMKKKTGQYLKFKSIPKWHHFAWDMINQIANSRKSFIFSKFSEDEESTEYSKKKLDLDTIIIKLKLKIYNNISEFFDDLFKMIRHSIDFSQRINNAKHLSFCRTMEARIQKQIKKLKGEGKI